MDLKNHYHPIYIHRYIYIQNCEQLFNVFILFFPAVNGDFRFYSTEENPCEVVYVGVNAVTSGGLSQKIVESRKKKNCLSVILTGIQIMIYY